MGGVSLPVQFALALRVLARGRALHASLVVEDLGSTGVTLTALALLALAAYCACTVQQPAPAIYAAILQV